MDVTKTEDKEGSAKEAATISEQERQEILSELTPIQKEEAEKFKSRLERRDLSDLREEWEYGKTVQNWMSDPVLYGSRFMQALARLYGIKPQHMQKRHAFFLTYTEEGLERLLKLRFTGTGRALTWIYVHATLSLPEEERWALLEDAVKNNWTSRQVQQLVARRNEERHGERNRGGPKIHIPAAPKDKIDKIERTVEPLVKQSLWWFDKRHGVLAALKSQGGNKLDKGLLPKVASLRQKVASSIAQLVAFEQQLVESEDHLKKGTQDEDEKSELDELDSGLPSQPVDLDADDEDAAEVEDEEDGEDGEDEDE